MSLANRRSTVILYSDSEGLYSHSIRIVLFEKDVQADSELLKKHAPLLKLHWQEIISKHVLTNEAPPRWILFLGNLQALLIDRTK